MKGGDSSSARDDAFTGTNVSLCHTPVCRDGKTRLVSGGACAALVAVGVMAEEAFSVNAALKSRWRFP